MGKNYLQHLHIQTRNWYINWDNRIPLHCIFQPEKDVFIGIILEDSTASWKKIICIISNQKLIHLWGWKCFPLCTTGNFPVYREILTITLGFFINFCTLINIFSTQVWFYHTNTHAYTHTHTHTLPTHITEVSIFISELLPLKRGVWLS